MDRGHTTKVEQADVVVQDERPEQPHDDLAIAVHNLCCLGNSGGCQNKRKREKGKLGGAKVSRQGNQISVKNRHGFIKQRSREERARTGSKDGAHGHAAGLEKRQDRVDVVDAVHLPSAMAAPNKTEQGVSVKRNQRGLRVEKAIYHRQRHWHKRHQQTHAQHHQQTHVQRTREDPLSGSGSFSPLRI